MHELYKRVVLNDNRADSGYNRAAYPNYAAMHKSLCHR